VDASSSPAGSDHYKFGGPTKIQAYQVSVDCGSDNLRQMSTDYGQIDNDGVAHEDACVTCGEEVKEEDEALHCDLCEVWEHLKCIKVCDRPSHECYVNTVGMQVTGFNCTKSRRKGTLVWWLLHAEVTLKSVQIQRNLYEQLLEEKCQKVDLLTFERDALKYEKERLESQPDEVRYELTALKLEHTVTTATTTPMHTTVTADNVASGRRKLPQLPVTVSPVHDPPHRSEHSVVTSGVKTEDLLREFQ